jgi:indole-3-glycerol phosphate synthase
MIQLLTEICDKKREEISGAKAARPMAALERDAVNASPPRGFARALEDKVKAGGYGLIAEIKMTSPSGGMIRPDFDPAALAKAYERGGAACLSVLTDKPYFNGEVAHLTAARQACKLPVLRKDFMLDPYQVFEARAMGADCILLILAALSDEEAAELERVANSLSMDVLTEVHDSFEMERALKLKTRLIGVNNRNLRSLLTDLTTTEELALLVPSDRILVSESGIATPADLARLSRAGARCFLIGEALLRQKNVADATRALLAPVKAPV